MIDYARIRQRAAAGLQRAGMAVTLLRPTGGVYNSATGRYTTPATNAGTALWAVSGPITAGYTLRNPGIGIEAHDQLLYIEAGKITPVMTDRIQIGSAIWSIINMETISPAGTAVLYTLHIRP